MFITRKVAKLTSKLYQELTGRSNQIPTKPEPFEGSRVKRLLSHSSETDYFLHAMIAKVKH